MNQRVASGIILSLLLTVNFQAADSSAVDPKKVQKAEVFCGLNYFLLAKAVNTDGIRSRYCKFSKTNPAMPFEGIFRSRIIVGSLGYQKVHVPSILSDITRNGITGGS